MTRNARFALTAAAAAALAHPAAALDFDDVIVTDWVGQGQNTALLIIDWNQAGGAYAFGYRWDGTRTGYDMLTDIAANTGLAFYDDGGGGFGTVYGLGLDTNNDGFSLLGNPSADDARTPADPDDIYAEGWFTAGYWGYYDAPNGTDWAYPGNGFRDITLTDGTWQGWSWAQDFNAAPPTVPVPAPGVGALIAAAALPLARRKRR